MSGNPNPTLRNRPAREPGGCECEVCGCIFIGEPWHRRCGVCFADAETAVDALTGCADDQSELGHAIKAVMADGRRDSVAPIELLARAKNQLVNTCIERDAAQEEVVRLRSTLREIIAAFDRAAIALDSAGDKIAASGSAVAIGNARKVLGDG